jgi:hypothetical protein
MPEQVTARIQAARIAEGARQAPPSAGRVPGRPGPASQPARSRHAAGRAGDGRRWRLPELLSPVAVRGFAAAAAAAVIAGGIYGAVQLAGGQSGATSGIASAPAAGLHGAAMTGPPLTYGPAGRRSHFTPVSTGLNFQPGLLKSQVRSVLPAPAAALPVNQPQAATRQPGGAPASSGSTTGRRSFGGIPVSALQGCVTRISAGRKVLLVDVDRYQGKRATIIVVAGAGDTGGARVWVVGPGCSRTGSDVIAQASLPSAG